MYEDMHDITDFYRLVEREAVAEGPQAVAHLRHLETVYSLSARIVGRRLERGITQQQLAAASGIRQSEISRIEGARGNPTVKTISALAAALELDLRLVPHVGIEAEPAERSAAGSG
jgi:ribosome-binding protein aMBF1 (putative translation factor)